MQIIRVPRGNMSYIIQTRNLSAFKCRNPRQKEDRRRVLARNKNSAFLKMYKGAAEPAVLQKHENAADADRLLRTQRVSPREAKLSRSTQC